MAVAQEFEAQKNSSKKYQSQEITYPKSIISRNNIGEEERVVVTDEVIDRNTNFGPFPGEDATDVDYKNWMKNITTVKNFDESNLVIGVFKKQLYFQCIHTIHIGSELVVWGGTISSHLGDQSEWNREGINEGVFTFLCQNCCKTFTSVYLLTIHWNTKHRSKEERVPEKNCKCPCCPKIIPSKRNYRDHVLRHGIKNSLMLSRRKPAKQ